ncbi:carbohydrate porin [Acinetobacter sp. AKBS16]|uniref:carbohydrate porin n=1 Tax=Acinetobacter sp. AKBS16 TaxID=2072504 RepID=UPI000CCE1079|nr:carbohydrate porin [Acinetobacter sp. AKBS16]PNW15977.1 porin [Acinetobacter sp. AKBS16]
MKTVNYVTDNLFSHRYLSIVLLFAGGFLSAGINNANADDEVFKPHVVITNQTVGNLDTGPRPHSFANAGAIFTGADVNLGKLMGNDAGTLQFEYTFFPWLHNTGLQSSTKWQGAAGSAFAGATLHNDIDSTGYLSLFAYNQMLLDDHLQITLGRTNAQRYFYISSCGAMIACNDPLFMYTTGILPYPYGSWGAYSKYKMDNGFYTHGGVFESTPQDYANKTNGLQWGLDGSSKATSLFGFGHQETIAQNPLPHKYELNVFSNSAKQVDSDSGKEHNSKGILFRFNQTIYNNNPTSKDLDKAWQVFGAWSWNADEFQPFQQFIEAGISRIGPFGRPQDSVNLKASYLRLSEKQAEFQTQQRLDATGIDQSTSRGESRVELNMHWQATNYLAVEPSIQYIFNPSNFYNPTAKPNKDGAVVGLQIVYNLGGRLGL